jgi:hypothetical protein
MKYREQQAVKTRPKWLSKIVLIHRLWHECTHRLTVCAAWITAAIVHTPSAILMWQIDTLSISRKIEEQCKPQVPKRPDQTVGVRLPELNDMLSWFAGIGPKPG